jgi:hypothetical protein
MILAYSVYGKKRDAASFTHSQQRGESCQKTTLLGDKLRDETFVVKHGDAECLIRYRAPRPSPAVPPPLSGE